MSLRSQPLVFLLPGLAILLAACRSVSPNAEGPPSQASLWCPPPLTWSAGSTRPVMLAVSNQTSRRLGVYLDNCDGHTRLGYVTPMRTDRFRLPQRLIPVGEGLRVYMVDHGAKSIYGIYDVPLREDWTLDLTVGDSTRQAEVRPSDNLQRAPGPLEGPRGFETYPGEELSYASVWAEGRSAVLSWVCTQGEPDLVFSPTATDAEEVEVQLTFHGHAAVIQGPWTVVHGRTDNLRAPASLREAITLEGLRATGLTLMVLGDRASTRHHFPLEGMQAALASLPCWETGSQGRGGGGRLGDASRE